MLPALVLAGLVLVAGLSGAHGRRGAVVLAAVSVLWILVNGPMEGVVLVRLTDVNGLTGGDLAGLAGLWLAAYRLYRSPGGGPLARIGRSPRFHRRWP